MFSSKAFLHFLFHFFFLIFTGYIGPGVNLGIGCVIGAGCRLTVPEIIPDNTVIFGTKCARRISTDKPPVCIVLVLPEMIPEFASNEVRFNLIHFFFSVPATTARFFD